MGDTAAIDFCTLGMFIIDEIHPSPSAQDQVPQFNIIGGGGTYSAVGARLFCPSPVASRSVGWIVDVGNDFPPELHSIIASWDTGALLRPRDAPTTRGWNGYSGNEHRAFRYLTDKKRLTADDLTLPLLASKSFHLICSASRCIDQAKSLLARRTAAFGPSFPPPLLIWEPVPDLCIPSELRLTYDALRYVDVISPNHEELGALFAFTHLSSVARTAVENHAQRFLERGIGRNGTGAVVVRAGKEGCFILSPTVRSWLPAYHTDARRVLDPTGGGNAFLGGLGIGLVRTNGDVLDAARCGSVAASFAIEQVGMPTLTPERNPGDVELWNGVGVYGRYAEFRARTA